MLSLLKPVSAQIVSGRVLQLSPLENLEHQMLEMGKEESLPCVMQPMRVGRTEGFLKLSPHCLLYIYLLQSSLPFPLSCNNVEFTNAFRTKQGFLESNMIGWGKGHFLPVLNVLLWAWVIQKDLILRD